MLKEQTKTEQSNKIPNRILEKSKLTALHFLEIFPDAKIYPFEPILNGEMKCHVSWSKHPGFSAEQIISYKKSVLWGLKMSSVPLCVLDFDIKTEDHPEGMSEKKFEKLKIQFNLNNYPCFSKGKSGRGGHFWFKQDDTTPKEETNMDLIQGVDYKVKTIMFLIDNPFPFGIKDLRSLPKEYLNLKDKTGQKKEGRFNEQQRTSWKHFHNNNWKGIFESYHIARKKGQPQGQALSVAEPTLEKLIHKINKVSHNETLKTRQDILEYMKIKLSDAMAKVDLDKKIAEHKFHDHDKIFPMNNSFLLCGDTESGKTAHSLNFLKDQINSNKKVVIWEHSETNRINRLNKWILDNQLKRENIFISRDRKQIIDKIEKDAIIFIDDTDSFFLIDKPTDRREVADTLEAISWTCQIVECLILLLHYQTKASKGEKSHKLRSGGSMSWLNKTRYGGIIEIFQVDNKITEDTTGKRTEEKIEKSALILQKGFRGKDNTLPSAWWLTSDYKIGDPITKLERDTLLTDKVENKEGRRSEVITLIDDWFLDNPDKKEYPSKDFYEDLRKTGIKESTARKYINESREYQFDRAGLGKGHRSFIRKL